MQSTANQGIIVNGPGTITAAQIAVGHGASISGIAGHAAADQRTIEHLQQELDALLVLLRKESASLPPEAAAKVEFVAKEVKSAAPDKLVVTSVLDSVARLVTSFGALSGAIIAVKELAGAVLK
jgi:hypothetical protein